MDFVKLTTRYYLDQALLRAGEAAEVLWCRGKAYAGGEESDGFIPTEVLPLLCPTRGKARAAALVREGLWMPVDGGWVDLRWATERQATKESLRETRAAGSERVRRYRERNRNGVTPTTRNAVTNADVAPTEVEVEVEDAAAAASREPLPPPVEILRTRLEAAKLPPVIWSRLTPAQIDEITELIAAHGDAALVKAAMVAHRPEHPAAYAQAWIGRWRELRTPGSGLALVAERCTEWGHSGTVRHCIECAGEKNAGGL